MERSSEFCAPRASAPAKFNRPPAPPPAAIR
jgi:hypothetical protein